MATRNSAKISAEIKSYLDDAIKNLVTKSDIDSLKSFIEEQSAPIKNLTEKIWTLDEKLNASEASIEKLNDKITNLEGKLAYFESQDELKSGKVDDLEQYGRRESLRFKGKAFQQIIVKFKGFVPRKKFMGPGNTKLTSQSIWI